MAAEATIHATHKDFHGPIHAAILPCLYHIPSYAQVKSLFRKISCVRGSVARMVTISEWLPNPVGSDTKGEWVELRNGSAASVSLSGWRLTADGKKFFALRGAIAPGGYLVVPRSASKLSLQNTDGKLALYDAAGRLADHAEFRGAAPEGKSANHQGETAVFANPTPAAANAAGASAAVVYQNEYPIGI